jgi:GT2 family glycosyltransferase
VSVADSVEQSDTPALSAPSLSVIVPVHNAGFALAAQLAALASQRYPAPWEVIVVDNRSTDGSAELARRFVSRMADLRVIPALNGVGPAYARNFGAAHAKGDGLIFVDQDDQVAPGYLEAMGRALAVHDFVGARVDHVKLNRARFAGNRSWQSEGIMPGSYFPTTSGCAMGIKRTLFEQLGGFDERFLYSQDIDLSWRAQLAGFGLVFVPDALLHYRHRHRVADHLRQEYRWGTDEALLCRTHPDSHKEESRLWRALSEWRQIFRAALAARTQGDAVRVASRAARRLGRLRGSVRYRIWCP